MGVHLQGILRVAGRRVVLLGAAPLLVALLGAALVSSLAACSLASSGGSASRRSTAHATPTATSAPTPVSVYVSASYNHVVALDAATGAVRWSVTTTGQPQRPLFVQGVIYVASQVNTTVVSGVSYISALRASDGSLLWIHKLGDFIFNPNTDAALAWAYGIVYVSAQANIYAIRAGDGGELWQATLPADTAPPAVGAGVVYTLTWSDGPGDHLVALDAITGAIRWQSATLTGDGNEPRAPLVADGAVYADTGGALYALGADDGALRWEEGGFQGVSLTPALVQGVVFDANGDTAAYQAAMGQSVWSIPGTTSHVNYSLVADAGGVYVVSADGYVARDLATGQQNWTATVISPTFPVLLALAGNTLYSVDDDTVMALHTADGGAMWSVTLSDRMQTFVTPAVG